MFLIQLLEWRVVVVTHLFNVLHKHALIHTHTSHIQCSRAHTRTQTHTQTHTLTHILDCTLHEHTCTQTHIQVPLL